MKVCLYYSLVADYMHKTHLENTDQEFCERVEGFLENLVLQIQSVPPAVWAPPPHPPVSVCILCPHTAFVIIVTISTAQPP